MMGQGHLKVRSDENIGMSALTYPGERPVYDNFLVCVYSPSR